MPVHPYDEPLSHALTRMIETNTRSFPVLREGRLTGIITRFDIFKALHEDTLTNSVMGSTPA
ncbi:MAG: CBS domain-containing protein [Gammaproteobacteria bacterium]